MPQNPIRQFRSGNWDGIKAAAVVVGAVAVLYLARDTFIPLAFAITLALLLSPFVTWLQKHGVHRAGGALLAMILTIVSVIGISYVIFNQLVQVVNELPTYRATIMEKAQALHKPAGGSLGRAAQNVKELSKELTNPTSTTTSRQKQAPVPVQMVEAPQDIISYLRSTVEPFVGPMAMLGIVLVFTVFLLVGEVDLRNRLFRLAGVGRLNAMTTALEDATRRVSRYLLLQFLVNAAFGALCGLGLFAIGVPYAVLWGTVAAVLRIVPYVGSIVAGVLPLILCLAVFDGWKQPLLVFTLFSALELVTANFLEPWLYGSHTGISSLALLLTTIFWATLWGPSGLILSTPLTVCVVVVGRHVKQLSFLHILLGDEQVLPADAQLYQRLLAMDDHEARLVAEEFRRDKSLLHLYDELILPAISMAEQDRHKGDLSPEREEFFFLTLRELLAEYSERGNDAAVPASGTTGRVLCLPANDEADELAAAMLAQLLDQASVTSIAFPLGVPSYEMLDLIKPGKEDTFCISSVPPFGFTHARTVARQLHAKFPQTRMVIGVWGFTGDLKAAAGRFKPLVPDQCVSSFADALKCLGEPGGTEASLDSNSQMA